MAIFNNFAMEKPFLPLLYKEGKRGSKNFGLILIILILGLIVSFALMDQVSAAYGTDLRLKQVKTVNSSTVYYLDHNLGVKKAYLTPASFLAYGNKWSNIKTINQAELNKWPDLKLVKVAGDKSSTIQEKVLDKNIYYIKGNKKTLIKSPSDFKKFNFDFSKVATIKLADFLAYQTVDYAIIGLISQPVNRPTEIARNGGGDPGILTVELDSANARSGFLPMGSRRNLIGIFNFKASNRAAEIKEIGLSFQGVFKSEVIEKVYLTNESDYVLMENLGLNNRQAIFYFGSLPLIISPGETRKIKLYVDLKSYDDFINHSLKASLNSYKDITANVQVNGNFPVTAGEYKLAMGSLMGQAKIEELAVNLGTKLTIGNNEKNIGKFKISETSGKENVIVKKITFINEGSARSADLANFKLKDTSNNILAQAKSMENDAIIFNPPDLIINKEQDKTFLIFADIIGGDGKTANFKISNFQATGSAYGYGVNFTQTDNNETFIIGRESLNVLSLDLKPSQKIFSKQSGVILGSFQARSNNQRVRLVSINARLEKSANAPDLKDSLYLVNYDSGEVYSAADASRLSQGISLNFNGAVIEPRSELNFSLLANLPALYLSGDRYRIVLTKIVYVFDSGAVFEDNPNLGGVYLTATKSSLYVYPNNDNSERSFTKGQKDVKIASFIMEAAAGDNLEINQITLTKSGDTSGSVLYENGFSNLRLFIGGSRVGNAILTPSNSTYVFDNFSYRFGAGDRAELRLYADTERDLKVSETQLVILSIGAKSTASYVPSQISGLKSLSRKVYFGGNEAEIKALNGGSFTPNLKDNSVGRFSVTNNGAEDLRMDSVTIYTTNDGFSYSLGFYDLQIIEASQAQRIGSIGRPVAGANEISLGGFALKPSQTAEFIIRVSADKNVPTTGWEMYLSELVAYGRKSGLLTIVKGDPTQKMPINSTSFNLDSGETGNALALSWPVDSKKINYGFHDSSYPFRSAAEHDGIDIDVDQGSVVKSAANGVVVELANNQNAQYNYLIIQHEQGLKTVYGHLSEIRVKVGDIVESGQLIGLSGGLPGGIGSGPNTNGPHLHFGVSQDHKFVDPMGWLK